MRRSCCNFFNFFSGYSGIYNNLNPPPPPPFKWRDFSYPLRLKQAAIDSRSHESFVSCSINFSYVSGLFCVIGMSWSPVPSCQITMYYYVGFAYLMMRRYSDAIKCFTDILLYIQRTKNVFHVRWAFLAVLVMTCEVRHNYWLCEIRGLFSNSSLFFRKCKFNQNMIKKVETVKYLNTLKII